MKLLSKIKNTIWRRLLMPFCQLYSRYIIGDKPADSILRVLSSRYFKNRHGYNPNFKNPKSFSEKIFYRMFLERNPLLTTLSDKLLSRNYVAERVGDDYLIPLLWKGNDPEQIPFDDLPLKFVIKATHGCKYNIIVKDKTKLNKTKVVRQLKKWLNENFCLDHFLGIEWGYKNITPYLIIETFIDDNGKEPLDYKFFCYSGQAEFLQMNFDRHTNESEKFFDRNFDPLDLWNGSKQQENKVVPPDNYQEMISLSETLSKGLDFIRVDLYSVNNRIFVGELTCYPAGGIIPFIPRKYDYIFGEKWIIKNSNL